MKKIKTNIKPQLEYLRRLSIVWASALRLKIVTELYLREMSPKQFRAEFGGGSLSRIDKNFKMLVKYRWLRHSWSEGPGGARRGATEHFYRATELAVIDDESWALVPYSMRVAISWMTFKQLAERVRDALRAKVLAANAGSHLGWTSMVLDELGWERVMAALTALFESIFEEQDDAKLRVQHSGEKPTLATVGLAGFESAMRGLDVERTNPRLAAVTKDAPQPFPLRVSKAFADGLCLKIIAEANRREISAPLFFREFGGDTESGIRRRFKKMEKVGWLKRVDEKTGGPRRSAVEFFYKATGPAIFKKESWEELPASIKPLPCSWKTFLQFAEHVKDAIEAGTFEARLDNHFSWSLLCLDQEGWEKVSAAVDALLALVLREWEAAEARIANSGAKPISTTIALFVFQSPKGVFREP